MKSENKATANALLAALNDLTDEEMLALTDNPGKLKEFCGALVIENTQNTFVIPLSDNEVQEQYPQFTDRLASWRELAVLLDYRGPITWKVKQGFTLKTHAPLAGSCHDKLNYLQGWNFVDDPTTDSLVFWIPRLAKESTRKTIKQMEAHRVELKKRHELPESHATSFGSIQLLFALILAHFKRTGERVPLSCLYAASDTLNPDGNRLFAGDFGGDGLYCPDWNDSVGYGTVGFFLLGVEKLGQ
ncbi:MAG: hypothetical protein WC610_01445 [Patescibacteria group bacterium]